MVSIVGSWQPVVGIGLGAFLVVWVAADLRGEFLRGKREGERQFAEQGQPLVRRLTELQGQLQESAILLPALQAELELRSAALARLKADAEQYDMLATLKRGEAEAVQRLVEQTVTRGLSETSRASRREQVRFFCYGLLASVPLGLLVNALFEWMK
ncbi:hypothetical protein [Plantactinospora sonchi]|uniref:Uncharacterized protein n=1 Tax=Plantactinospora sonchi TaxID=1544735 RepID=A0ABU7RWT9_9ACTN